MASLTKTISQTVNMSPKFRPSPPKDLVKRIIGYMSERVSEVFLLNAELHQYHYYDCNSLPIVNNNRNVLHEFSVAKVIFTSDFFIQKNSFLPMKGLGINTS